MTDRQIAVLRCLRGDINVDRYLRELQGLPATSTGDLLHTTSEDMKPEPADRFEGVGD